MYGGVEANKEVGDNYQFDSKSRSYTIKDFRDGGEADIITVPEEDKDSLYPNENVSIGSEPTLEIMAWGNDVEVRIEGYTKDEIRGWVINAIENINLNKNYQVETPIVFNTN
jgi:hypothetical protein